MVQARIAKLVLPLLVMAALAGCSHGYTSAGGDSGYRGYEGGAAVPAVLPQDRDSARGQ